MTASLVILAIASLLAAFHVLALARAFGVDPRDRFGESALGRRSW